MPGLPVVCQRITSRRAAMLLAILAVGASFCLGISLFLYSPLYIDSGWFSYPANALATRGDPGDNQLSIDQIRHLPGVTAIFSFDTRKSVRIIPLAAWFRFAGTDVWAVKTYAVIELFLLHGLIVFILLRIAPSPSLALIFWSLLVMDRALIESGTTDMRPDIFITILTLIIFFSISRTADFDRKKWLLAILLIPFLAMSHSTAAVPMAFLLTFVFLELMLHWRTVPTQQKVLMIFFLATGAAAYLLRRPLADLIIPTQYPVHGAIDVKEEVLDRLRRGPAHIFQTECIRWKNYFFVSNVATLAVIILIPALYVLIRTPGPTYRYTYPLSLLAGILILSIDPHLWPAHAIPLVPLFFIYLALMARFLSQSQQARLLCLLAILAIFAAMLKVAATAKLHKVNAATGYDHQVAINLLKKTFSAPTPDNHYLVIGPTELWPYLPATSNTTLVDTTRSQNIQSLRPHLQKIDYILLNHDYARLHWIERFEKTFPAYKVVLVGEVGRKAGHWAYMGLYRIKRQ